MGLDWRKENFGILLLNARARALGCELIAIGTLTACLVHPREVFRPAIEGGAAQIICWHNHPSGDVTPSDEDRALFRRMDEAGQVLGIPVADHLILSPHDEWSAHTAS